MYNQLFGILGTQLRKRFKIFIGFTEQFIIMYLFPHCWIVPVITNLYYNFSEHLSN